MKYFSGQAACGSCGKVLTTATNVPEDQLYAAADAVSSKAFCPGHSKNANLDFQWTETPAPRAAPAVAPVEAPAPVVDVLPAPVVRLNADGIAYEDLERIEREDAEQAERERLSVEARNGTARS